MKIGYPNNPREDIEKEIRWIGENFDFIDFFMEEDKGAWHLIDARKIKRLLNEYELDIMGHTAYYLPFASPVKSLRTAAVEEAFHCIEVFSELGAKYVTVHSSWPPSIFNFKEGMEWQIDSLKKLVDKGKEHGIKIIYEPGVSEYDNVNTVGKILREIPQLGLHLDIGHANLHGRNPCKFIRKFGRRIEHIHIHDNFGKEDLHLPIGIGKIKWEEVIKELKKFYNRTITLEVFAPRRYVLLSKKIFMEMWSGKEAFS